MKLYTYKAMDKSGSIVFDTIKAGSISEVEIEIENRKLVSIKISEKKDFFSLFSNNKKILARRYYFGSRFILSARFRGISVFFSTEA